MTEENPDTNEYVIVGTITFLTHKTNNLVVKLCGTNPGFYAKFKDSEYNLFWKTENEKKPEIIPEFVQKEFTVPQQLAHIVTDLALKKQKAKIHVTGLESDGKSAQRKVVGATIETEG